MWRHILYIRSLHISNILSIPKVFKSTDTYFVGQHLGSLIVTVCTVLLKLCKEARPKTGSLNLVSNSSHGEITHKEPVVFFSWQTLLLSCIGGTHVVLSNISALHKRVYFNLHQSLCSKWPKSHSPSLLNKINHKAVRISTALWKRGWVKQL